MLTLFICNQTKNLSRPDEIGSFFSSSERINHKTMHNTALEMLHKAVSLQSKSTDQQTGKLPEIITNELGKPSFSNPELPKFNWSHSGSLILLGTSRLPIGTDIELEKNRNTELISQKYFSCYEQDYIKKDPVANFFKIWVIRESIGKYIGNGIQAFESLEINPFKREARYHITEKTKVDDEALQDAYIYTCSIDRYHMAAVARDTTVKVYEASSNLSIEKEMNWHLWGSCKMVFR